MVKCRQDAGFLAWRAAGWGVFFPLPAPHIPATFGGGMGEGGVKSESEGEVKEEAVNRNAAEIS